MLCQTKLLGAVLALPPQLGDLQRLWHECIMYHDISDTAWLGPRVVRRKITYRAEQIHQTRQDGIGPSVFVGLSSCVLKRQLKHASHDHDQDHLGTKRSRR